MRGEQPNIRDVELNLESLVLPENWAVTFDNYS